MAPIAQPRQLPAPDLHRFPVQDTPVVFGIKRDHECNRYILHGNRFACAHGHSKRATPAGR